MIKIEITDLNALDAATLRETGRYFMALSAVEEPAPAPVVEEPAPAPVVEEPAPAPVVEEPAPAPVVEEPAPAPVVEEPAPAPVVEEPAPAPVVEEPAPAPVVPPPIPVPPASEVFKKTELDVDGFPWDSRIHARTKTKTKDGRWKKIRGVGLEVVKKIENELKTVQDIPAPPVSTAPTHTSLTFADLMTKITRAITDGVLKRDQVVDVLKPLGIPSLPVLSTRPDLIPAVMKSLDEVINAA